MADIALNAALDAGQHHGVMFPEQWTWLFLFGPCHSWAGLHTQGGQWAFTVSGQLHQQHVQFKNLGRLEGM